MRRLVAILSLLSLANLVFARAGAACPLSSVEPSSTEVASGHEGHDMSAMALTQEVVQSPDETTSHHSACPAMNACVVSLEVVREEPPGLSIQVMHVAGHSDDRPASLTTTPELPPPRA